MIMVIGGYGQVGGFLSKEIKNVIVAGRNGEKAAAFIVNNNVQGSPRCIDTCALKQDDFHDVDTIVMCVEDHNFDVLSACIRYNINYIDISPSYEILSKLMTCKEEILQSGICCILGVGIAPGISNLLCKKACEGFEQIASIDSYLMLGLGERHGVNAILWLLKHIYSTTSDINSFIEKCKVTLPRQKGTKTQVMTRIDLADWHIMKAKHPDAACRSWFAYDINWITHAVCFMKKIGMFKSLNISDKEKRSKAITRFQKMMGLELKAAHFLHIGTEEYNTRVDVCGMKNGQPAKKSLSVSGYCNSELTAHAAASVAIHMDQLPAGMHFLEDVIDIDRIGIHYTEC